MYSLTKLILLLSGTGVAGIVVGYFARIVILMAKKGSMELTIKQQLLDARAQADTVIKEAEGKAGSIIEEAKKVEREKEGQLKKLEERLLAKDELLDRRQQDIDKEVEQIKVRIQEIKDMKEKVE